MLKNHWGIQVDSETPITGVETNNRIEFLADEIYSSNSINLTFETWVKEECPSIEEQEDYEWSNDQTFLIGSWKKDSDGLYIPDQTGEYSAIVGEIYTQVVWSRTTKKCALCSPCYPGQADLDSTGEFLAYCLPDDLMGNIL
jgi:hypothetical protein